MDVLPPHLPEDRVRAKLAKAEQTLKHKHPLPPEIIDKVNAENRRQTLLKYLLIVLLGIFLLIALTIVESIAKLLS